MIILKLPKDLEDRLSRLIKITNKTDYFICEALKKYLEENESTFIAVARFEESMEPVSSDGEKIRPQRIEESPDNSTEHPLTEDASSKLRNSQMRILVADDSPVNRAVTLVILKSLGYQADSVTNGAEALNTLESTPYDAVLMDCMMPKIDGYEATKLIRQVESNVLNHNIPIIAITAHATKIDRDKCFEIGMNHHLAKPLEPDELAETLTKLLHNIPTDSVSESPQEVKKTAFMPTPEGTNTVFNEVTLFERLMEDRDLCLDILATYLEDIQKQIVALKERLDSKDATGIRELGHTIKGRQPMWKQAKCCQSPMRWKRPEKIVNSTGPMKYSPVLKNNLNSFSPP